MSDTLKDIFITARRTSSSRAHDTMSSYISVIKALITLINVNTYAIIASLGRRLASISTEVMVSVEEFIMRAIEWLSREGGRRYGLNSELFILSTIYETAMVNTLYPAGYAGGWHRSFVWDFVFPGMVLCYVWIDESLEGTSRPGQQAWCGRYPADDTV